jgi:hypothetical protein
LTRPDYAWTILLLIPLGTLAAALIRYATDFPKGYDDVGTAASLLRLLEAPTLEARWAALFEQNNEHRVLFLRAFVAGWYALTDQYSHVTFAVASCGCLVGIAALFYPVVRAKSLPPSAFLPVPFVLLALNQMDNQLSVFGLQNFGVVLGALLFFRWLTLAPSRWGYLAAALTGLSSGSGLLALGIGLGLLAYRRRWRDLLGYSLLTALVVGLYFRTLHLPAHPRDWAAIARSWFRNLGDFLAMSTEVHTFVHPLQPVLFGLGWALLLGLLGWMAWWVFRRQAPSADLFLTSVVGLVLGSGLLVAVLRGEGSPAMAGRYKIYSALLLVVGYFWTLDALRKYVSLRALLPLASAGAMAWFGLVTLKYWPDLRFHRDQALAHTLSWRQPGHPWHETLRREQTRLRSGRVVAPVSALERALNAPVRASAPVSIDHLEDDGQTLTISNATFRRGAGSDDGAFVVLRSPRYTAVFPVRYRCRYGQLSGGFTAQVTRRFLFQGEYQIGFLVGEGGQYRFFLTDQKLSAPASPLDWGVLP